MALILKSLARVKLSIPNVTTTPMAAITTIYSVTGPRAALLKSIVLTNVIASDVVINGIYLGRKGFVLGLAVVPVIADVNPQSGNSAFFRVAPMPLRVPAGQQIVLDTELVMVADATSTDYLVVEFLSGTAVSNVIDMVVNGAERDQ
jgi:hypothetical protein